MAGQLLMPLPEQYPTLELWAEAVSAMLDVFLRESGNQGLILPILDIQGRPIVTEEGVYAYDDFNLDIPISPTIVQIDTGQLVDAAITTNKIANLSVDTQKLAALSVEAAKLADSAVTAEKIANLAVGTAAIQALAVGTAQIANAAIVSALIGDLAVLTANIDDLAVNEAKIANLAVGSVKIQDAAITNAKLGTASISTANIRNAAITAALIGTAVINSSHIEDATITSAKIKGLDADKIIAGTITADKYKELRNTIELTHTDSLDIDHPMFFDFIIPSEVTKIVSAKISYKIYPFRAYSRGAELAELEGILLPKHITPHRHLISTRQFSSSGFRGGPWFDAPRVDRGTSGETFFSNERSGILLHMSGDHTLRVQTDMPYFETSVDSGEDPVDRTHTHDIIVQSIDDRQHIGLGGLFIAWQGNAPGSDPVNISPLFMDNFDMAFTTTADPEDGHTHSLLTSNNINRSGLEDLHFARSGVDHAVFGTSFDGSEHNFLTTGYANQTLKTVIDPHQHTLSFGIQEQSTEGLFVGFEIDNGEGFGQTEIWDIVGKFEVDITGRLSGTGFKAVRFITNKQCRVHAFLELKVDLTA